MHFPPGVAGKATPLIHTRYLIAHELAARGHEVYLYCSEDTETYGSVHKVSSGIMSAWHTRMKDGIPTVSEGMILGDSVHYSKMYSDAGAGKLDVILSSNPVRGMAYQAQSAVPSVFTLHDPLTAPYFTFLEQFAPLKNHSYVTISDNQRIGGPRIPYAATIHHGIDCATVPYGNGEGGYLVYFGRIIENKGVDRAIEVAKRAGTPLKIIGNHYAKGPGAEYWETKILPHIDGSTVEYLGTLDKNPLYEVVANATAFLNMLQWEEPFGMTMLESLACGTPVIAMRRGAAPEIIADGLTGFIVETEDDAVKAVSRLGSIQRSACRERAEKTFGFSEYVDKYERVLREACGSL
jgi:glycosyltransferase involved in cell wall biosynthesis